MNHIQVCHKHRTPLMLAACPDGLSSCAVAHYACPDCRRSHPAPKNCSGGKLRTAGGWLSVAFFLVACSGTKPVPTPDIAPPLPVIQPQPDDVAACARLGILGCPEAWPKNTTCVEAFSRIRTLSQDSSQDAGVVGIATCVANAADVATVRRCGDRSTLTVTCAGK